MLFLVLLLSLVSQKAAVDDKVLKQAVLTPGSISVHRLITSLCQLLSGSRTTSRMTSLCFFKVSFLSKRSNQSRSFGRFFSGPYPCRRAPVLLQMLPHFLLMPLFFTSLFFCFYVLIIYWPSCFFAAGKSGMRLRNYKHKGVGCTHSTLSIWRRYHIREKTYSQRTTTK